MVFTVERSQKRVDLETAIDLAGYGKYNMAMLCSCCLLILAVCIDMFGFSVLLPAAACDMGLSTVEQGLLSAVPLIGITFSSYAWGLFVDTLGRRRSLFIAMPLASCLNLACSMAPNYTSLIILKLLSAMFTSCANTAAIVLVAESVPKRHRSKSIFILACSSFSTHSIISLFAYPIFTLSFNINIDWLGMQYRPWRLLMQVISIPGIIGIVIMFFLKESPKYLIIKERSEEALEALRYIYVCNTGLDSSNYPVDSVYSDEILDPVECTTAIRKIWDQTAPLFKPPLLKNSLKFYYILLCAFMISTGYVIWVPTMTNAYFMGDNTDGRTFCEVASKSSSLSTNTTYIDCDTIIKPMTLYAVFAYSAGSVIVCWLISFLSGRVGKKTTTISVISMTIICGIFLIFVRVPMLSIALFYLFLYVALILGNISTYIVELNPTHLRGMATCLSVVVARGFGFISVQIVGSLLADYCTPALVGYVLLNISGLLVAVFLPTEKKREKQKSIAERLHSIQYEKTKL